jgi:hypothetical protein
MVAAGSVSVKGNTTFVAPKHEGCLANMIRLIFIRRLFQAKASMVNQEQISAWPGVKTV